MLRVGLAQLNFCVGAIEENRDKIIDCLKKARKKEVDIIVFPELALVGYPPQDLLLKPHFITRNEEALKEITHYCEGIMCIVGFVATSVQRRIHNAYALLYNKRVIDIGYKVHLPNYGVFDEKRYFIPGRLSTAYNFKDYKFNINICEDIWERSFIDKLSGHNFDFLINISASPFHLAKLKARRDILSYAAKRLNCYVFYCNLIGGEDDLVFDGTSMVVSPKGELLRIGKRFKEELILFDFEPSRKYKTVKFKEDIASTAFEALSLGIKDYVKKNTFKKVIVGVSGGIDSAVVTALATLSLGKVNVRALIMPSVYTSKATLRDAQLLCNNLGIKYFIISIQEIFEVYLRVLKPFFVKYGEDKTEENLQARIRGNLLMAFSNKLGYLVLNTGNKSELSCGYCTLYGDMVGGFGVLSDVPKTLVYKLAHYINHYCKREVIPKSIIRRTPTAELKPKQKDTDTLPPYPLLDKILKLYIEDDLSREQILTQGMDEALVEKVIRMVDSNEYKRRQAPVGIKITPRAFGKDRRMPITNKFRG